MTRNSSDSDSARLFACGGKHFIPVESYTQLMNGSVLLFSFLIKFMWSDREQANTELNIPNIHAFYLG